MTRTSYADCPRIVKGTMNFCGFNNVIGAQEFIVPNIIHFIRFKTFELSFVEYVVLLSALRNH